MPVALALVEPSVPGHPLAAVLARVDAMLDHAVQAMAADGGAAPDPLRGLYLTTEDATRQLRRGPAPLADTNGRLRPLVDLAEAGVPWRCLASVFGLSAPEIDALAILIAPELDLRYERVIGYLHDDLTRRRPTLDLLAQLLCRDLDERLSLYRLFEAESPLVRFGLVELLVDSSQPGTARIARPLRPEPGILRFLLEGNPIDRRIEHALEVDPVEGGLDVPEELDPLAVHLGSRAGRPVLLAGPDRERKRELARLTAAQLGRPLLIARLDRLTRSEVGSERAVFLAARVARLIDAVLLWWDADPDPDTGIPAEPGSRAQMMARATELFGIEASAIAVDDAAVGARLDLPSVVIPLPDAAARRRRWSKSLEKLGATLPAEDVLLLAEVFPFDGVAIDRSISMLSERPGARGATLSRDALVQAAQSQLAPTLAQGATRLETRATWDDIVLPADQLTQLRELTDRVRHRHTVITQWGFGSALRVGSGMTALFAGPSGSGKTLAAQIIASSLGVELYRVDIPRVVSKYIGETEKLLDGLFRAARHGSAILFFDEADALFGKRSEVRDAHDRYANIEVSYLLQALEEHDGLTLLATNLRHNLDDAFVRRLSFCVPFPFPEESERRRIWAHAWPHEAPVAADVDFDFLAQRFKLTGGNIRNVVVAAAFMAVADKSPVTMAHVIRGVRREYQKMGKTCAESEFGPYFAMLTASTEAA